MRLFPGLNRVPRLRAGRPGATRTFAGVTLALIVLAAHGSPAAGSTLVAVDAGSSTPARAPAPAPPPQLPPRVYLPLVLNPPPAATPVCPTVSVNSYHGGLATQFDTDNPVRPAWNHADKSVKMRWWALNADSGLTRDLVDYTDPPGKQPPQFATLFSPARFPGLLSYYRVYNWVWADSPQPGSRGDLLTFYRVTALGLRSTRGEALHVPLSGYDLGQGVAAIVLFADDRTVALRYTREDSSGSPGFTVHIDNICTDPNLLALYNVLDAPDGPRYQYKGTGYSYDLPALGPGQPFGTARGSEIVVAMVDTGNFLDPRSCRDWWQIRPGYAGGCPTHD